MAQDTTELPAHCGGITCDAKSLYEVDSGRVMVTVDRTAIQSIALRTGLLAPSPILQSAFGAILLGVGYPPLIHLLDWLRLGGTIYLPFLLLFAPAVYGLSLLLSVFRRGRYLEVTSSQGTKRLTLDRKCSDADVEAFLKAVERGYDLRISR